MGDLIQVIDVICTQKSSYLELIPQLPSIFAQNPHAKKMIKNYFRPQWIAAIANKDLQKMEQFMHAFPDLMEERVFEQNRNALQFWMYEREKAKNPNHKFLGRKVYLYAPDEVVIKKPQDLCFRKDVEYRFKSA